MIGYHKHKGYESNGALKNHPVSQVHSNFSTQLHHNRAVKLTPATKTKFVSRIVGPFVPKVPVTPSFPGVSVVDGFLYVDVTAIPQKGLRVKFQRVSGRYKKTVGVEFNK